MSSVDYHVSYSSPKWGANWDRLYLANSLGLGFEDVEAQHHNDPCLRPIYWSAPRVLFGETANFEKMQFVKDWYHRERNNSNKSDIGPFTPASDSDIYRNCQYSGRVIRVEGDGRCLFRSLVTCSCDQLQKAIRDEFGCPVRQEEAALETLMADKLRQQVVRLMEDNAHFYTQLGKDVINADQPTNQQEEYRRFGERLDAMIIPSTMPGDLELNATSTVLECRIIVLDVNLRYIFLYGKDRFPEAQVYAIRYTRLGPDVGHFDAVILDVPVNDLIGQFEMQKIDHLEPERDPSLHEFAALSIVNNSDSLLAQDFLKANNHDKSCQTQSNVALAINDEKHDNMAPGMKNGCGRKEPSGIEEGVCNEDIKKRVHKQTIESAPLHWKSLISSRSGHGRDLGLPHLAYSGVTNKAGVARISSANHIVTKREQIDRGSRKTVLANNRPLRKVPDGVCFPPPRSRNEKSCKPISKKQNSSRKRRYSACREQNRDSGDHAGGSEASRNKYKMAPTCRRKLQDCNENHNARKSRKRKSSNNEENSNKPSDRQNGNPSKLAQTVKKRKCTARGDSAQDNPIRVPQSPLQTAENRKISSRKDGFALDHLMPVPPPAMPLTSSKSKGTCFICLRTISVSRPLYVRCYLCCKIAHRPCVRNYLNWKLESDARTDEYFLCQRCVPL